MSVILVSSLLVAASLGCTPAPAPAPDVEIALDAAGLWEGTWLTADSSLDENVYSMLSIQEAGIRSFSYELENRLVPYGPNAEWFDGRAVFVDPLGAVDSEAGRTFRLRVDPGDRDERVIELDGESFLFQRTGVEGGEHSQQVTPIDEAAAFLDAMVACISENFDAIVESSGDTGPDMDELSARCGLDKESLSELARALVQDALVSHVMFGALAAALGDVEGEAAVAMLLDALAEAAADVRAMDVRGQLDQESEREVLEAFYHATGGPDWHSKSAWLSDLPLSAWSGVVTNPQGRVQVLGKANGGARGPIPPELGQLSSLEVLILSFNEFSGPIPPELGQLIGLEELLLNNNQLSGPIPVELGDLTELSRVSIDGDTGLCLPAEMRHTRFGQLAVRSYVPLCTALASDREALEALYHAIAGPLRPPNWLSDTPLSEWRGVTTNEQGRVERLDLSFYRLRGPIPPELAQLTSLKSLVLFFDESSGSIPPELGRLTNLARLGLLGTERGGLGGPIPPELGGLANLRDLSLANNQLSGPIPAELGQLVRLDVLSLANNQLSGPIPVELGDLTELSRVSIDGDTGLCLPAEIQDTVFGRLTTDNGNVPLCGTRGASLVPRAAEPGPTSIARSTASNRVYRRRLLGLARDLGTATLARGQFRALFNPEVQVTIEPPPGLNLSVNKITFGPSTGDCSEEIIQALISDFLDSGVEVSDRQQNLDLILQ